jgi:general secretion pathway protein A
VLRDPVTAWRELAQVWNLKAPEGDPCETLQRDHLHCFSREMTLEMVRQLGRPGILTLDAAAGQPAYAVLTSLGDTTATLRMGGVEQKVPLATLAQRWQGEFATYWKAPPGYAGRMADDATGPAVDWVAAKLAMTKGAMPRKSPRLDAALKAEVRAFQLAQGLPADGRPGPLTYMHLNRAMGVDEPRLRIEP